MPLAQLRVAFDHPDWIYELKYDGFRALAYVENGTARLISRKGNVYKSFSDLFNGIAAALPVRNAILDGEIVHLALEGVPQFYDLMRRRRPQHFYAFDLLWIDGRDLRDRPLLERKRRLRKVVGQQPSPVLYADHVTRTGIALFEAASARDLEGIVAKRSDGLYTPEATSWVKIKNRSYSQAERRAEFFEGRTFRAAL
jgi:bifunctional non-homologous end joining protein LigD